MGLAIELRTLLAVRYLIAFALVATLHVLPSEAHAQSADTTYFPAKRIGSIGVVVGATDNVQRANFQQLPGVPSCCPRYESGSGIVPNAFFEYERPVTERVGSDIRVGYSPLSGVLSTQQTTTVLDAEGTPTSAIFEHTVTATAPAITGQLLGRYVPASRLSITAGPTLLWVLRNTYAQKEVLLQPSTFGTFENGRRTRNESSGNTPDAAKLMFGVHAGIGYDLPIGPSGDVHANVPSAWTLRPELGATYYVTDLVHGLSWHAISIGVGLGLHHDLFETTPPLIVARTPAAHDTVAPPKPKPAFDLALDLIARDSLDRIYRLHQLTIEDYVRTQYRPLLNYIFFARDSSTLPGRYHQLSHEQASSFALKGLNSLETLPLYYEVLNIIGQRMQTYPTGRLTIVGCNDGSDKERSIPGLARARAQAVAHYLTTVWAIPTSRIKIESRDLPQKPSSPTEDDGAEENRRVEIYSNLWQVMEPVFTTDTAHVPKPSVVTFAPHGSVGSGIERWAVEVSESSNKIKEFSGRGNELSASVQNTTDSSATSSRIAGLPNELDWELEKEPQSLLARMDTVHASVTATDIRGEHAASADVVLPVRHYTLEDKHHEGSIDTIISRYSLILFDFDRSDLSDANRRIADFVRERISDKARVEILGYTDRIGSDVYNQQLSEARSKSTQHYIGLPNAEVKGLGRSILLYDNSLPEGRFYSRTVTVVVSTPTRR